MSYIRWSAESDIYCYESASGFVIDLTDGRQFTLPTEEEMFEKIRELAKDKDLIIPAWIL